MRYEGSKSGIFEAFPETRRTKVRLATGQARFHFPIPVLTTFLVTFGFAATMLALQGSVQTSKIVDFDPKYLKVQIYHFSEIFRVKLKFWMGGRVPHPISEIVPYIRFLIHESVGFGFILLVNPALHKIHREM